MKDNAEAKEEELYISKDKIKIAEMKNEKLANNKAIFVGVSTIVTMIATYYESDMKLVILSVFLFVIPNIIETNSLEPHNIVVKIITIVYKIVFWTIFSALFAILIWYIYNAEDAKKYSLFISKVLTYIDIVINCIISLFLSWNLRYNKNKHITLAVVEEMSIKRSYEQKEFKVFMEEEHKKNNRKHVIEISRKKGGSKK